MLPNLSGIEFDWFAVDSEGNLALIATAGEGFFPNSVFGNRAAHELLSEALPAPRTGTSEVWKDYADLGLYVFDWALPGGPYERQVTPSGKINHELQAKILAIPELPKFFGSFSGLQKLERWQ